MMKIIKATTEKALNAFAGEYREVFFEEQKGIGISFVNGETNMSSSVEAGFSINSTINGEQFFVSSSDMTVFDERVQELAKALPIGQTDNMCILKGEEEVVLNPGYPKEKIEEIITWTKEQIDLWQDDKLDNLTVMIRCSHRAFCVANTQNVFAQDEQKYHIIVIAATGKDGEVREEVYEKISGQDIMDSLTQQDIAQLFTQAKERLHEILEAKPSPSGVMDVIIGSEAGGTIIHESIGHPLEADGVHRTIYANKIGQKVAHESVSIIDDPTRNKLRGSYAIDHEGTPAQKTYLIKDGILVSYLHTNKTAKKYNTQSTGHARRQDYTYSTLVRMGNTYLEAGKETKEELISRVQNGIYVGAMGGGQVNPITGEFMFQVLYGKRIENGKLTEAIRGANISGIGPKMLQEIKGIANDLVYFDSGTCGKGQSCPVSDATPTMLVHLKVSGLQ